MEWLNGTGTRLGATEVSAALRIGGAIVVAVAVLLGPAGYDAGFLVTLAIGCVYALALAVPAARGVGGRGGVAIALADVAFVLALVAFSGGPLSEARLVLIAYPVAMALAHAGRAIALVTAVASAGFAAVSASSLGTRAADTAFAETLAVLLAAGAIGAALARAIQRRTREVQELAVDRAALLHEALDAEERERARIGERLHDDTLQSLLAAQQDVREARSGYLQSLEYADEALTDAVRALRETVLGLHPTALADRGLGVALHVELERAARRASLAVDLHVDPEAVGPRDALLYAAARELVTNAVKHAAAAHLEVRLERTAEAIVLTVADDGLGMVVAERAEQALAAGHVGLASTRQRIQAAGGQLEVGSAPGEGTTVRVTVPARVAVAAHEDDGRERRRAHHGGDQVEAERRFIAAVLENLVEGVIASDERDELRIVNAAARRYVEDEPLALGALADRGELHLAISGEPVGRDDLPLQRALRGEVVADEEYLAGDPAGERRWLVLAGRPIAASSGARGAIMTIRDVTEQRLAQRASVEAQERFRVAFDHAPVGMGIAGFDGRFWSANLALAELTGRRLGELRGATLVSLLHPDEVESSVAGLRALADGETTVHVTEKRLLHADGHEVPASVHVAVIRDSAGRPQHLLVQLQDITERRREEERLRTLADRDELTLLLNRTGFARELRRHAARGERYGTGGGVLMIDVDRLEAINGALGRGGGDDVLRRFANALESRVRRSDFAARVGGDEFAVLVPHGDAASLMALAEDLRERLERAQADSAERIGAPVTASIGAAVFGAGATEADTVWQRATTAMHAATRAGGGRALLFGPALLASPLD